MQREDVELGGCNAPIWDNLLYGAVSDDCHFAMPKNHTTILSALEVKSSRFVEFMDLLWMEKRIVFFVIINASPTHGETVAYHIQASIFPMTFLRQERM